MFILSNLPDRPTLLYHTIKYYNFHNITFVTKISYVLYRNYYVMLSVLGQPYEVLLQCLDKEKYKPGKLIKVCIWKIISFTSIYHEEIL